MLIDPRAAIEVLLYKGFDDLLEDASHIDFCVDLDALGDENELHFTVFANPEPDHDGLTQLTTLDDSTLLVCFSNVGSIHSIVLFVDRLRHGEDLLVRKQDS